VGLVTGREAFTSKRYGSDFVVLVVREEDGSELRVSCARSHLAQLVAEHDPQPGDGIAVTYFGERPDGFGFQYGIRTSKRGAAPAVDPQRPPAGDPATERALAAERDGRDAELEF
jgi:hypothetical protein